ncbi:MAG: tRNA threonylcarbamoyladenosine dehydratase [Oscillospiraceae bacterium]|nr:tRNA threonylcarbamoyladenosine dehydratase [Candidatus Ruminococcus equi]
MNERFSRSVALIGEENFTKLKNTNVIVFGVGGVGGYAVEMLCRNGVGKLTLVDNDTVSESNINRQIYALSSTISKHKVDVAKERIQDINPLCEVTPLKMFFTEENKDEIDFEKYDYIVDAIDTVSSKIILAKIAEEKNIPIISSMGTGNKLHPEMLEITDIYKTSVCPLARAMRKLLKENGVKKLTVVYSKEQPLTSGLKDGEKVVPSSASCVPSAAGIFMASKVINDIIESNQGE